MKKYIPLDALVAEIERLKERFIAFHHRDGNDWSLDNYGKMRAYNEVLSSLDTLEVKEVNEVLATVMVNKYGNRFISSWSGLKEYDNLKEGQEIKILIPKK